MILRYELKGSGEVKVPKNIISEDGVTAEYIGVEESVNIVNMKVSRKKTVKFRIVTSKDGDLKTPDISIESEGGVVHSGRMEFHVSQEKYVPRNSFFDFGDDFFDGRVHGLNRGRAYIEPLEDDLMIKFETNRTQIFVGETVIGYFLLYYKNLDTPFIERNEGRLLTFPYFTSELLSDVSITSRDKAKINGKEYSLQPYQREVYAITANKKGSFDLGEAEFFVEGAPTSYFSQRTMNSSGKSILVKELPQPAPQGFTGDVGSYRTAVSLNSRTAFLGSPIRFTVKVYGEGTASNLFNPLEKICQNPSDCDFEISLINEERSKKFVKLKNGSYGFYSELSFEYSLVPRKEGKLVLPSAKIHFFNPDTESYEIAEINISEIAVGARKEIEKTSIAEEVPYFRYMVYVLVGLSLSYLIYTFRDLLILLPGFLSQKMTDLSGYLLKRTPPGYLEKVHSLLPGFSLNRDPGIEKLDRIAGNKKSALLKNYLIQKGFSKQDSEFLTRIKKDNGNLPFRDFFYKLDEQTKKKLYECVKHLHQEDLNE